MKTILHYLILSGVIALIVGTNHNNTSQEAIAAGLGVGALIFIYLLPSYIAVRRNHTNAVPVILFNVFLGWTFVSWVWCLISACATVPPVQVIHQGNVTYNVSGKVDHYAHRSTHDDWGRPINYHD